MLQKLHIDNFAKSAIFDKKVVKLVNGYWEVTNACKLVELVVEWVCKAL